MRVIVKGFATPRSIRISFQIAILSFNFIYIKCINFKIQISHQIFRYTPCTFVNLRSSDIPSSVPFIVLFLPLIRLIRSCSYIMPVGFSF